MSIILRRMIGSLVGLGERRRASAGSGVGGDDWLVG